MRYPCLKINLPSISKNCKIINDRCTRSGMAVVGVLKSVTGDLRIARIFKDNGIDIFGDSRLKNLKKLRNYFGQKQRLILLRTPMISEVFEMLDICDTSMNTQRETVGMISGSCRKENKKHRIIIMVETDDRREGLMPGEVIDFCDYVTNNYGNIIIHGIGTNARCISDKSPLPESIGLLVKLKEEIEKKHSIKIPVVSGGNSSIWDLVEAGLIPDGVNQLRLGEIILFGHETVNYRKIKELYSDTFSLEAEIIEVKRKDNRIYKIIVALGLQDVYHKNIRCSSGSLKITAQSSDHTVIATRGRTVFKPGDIVSFKLDYFGLLSAMTSPFVEKIYIE